jgi:hypothetical protein
LIVGVVPKPPDTVALAVAFDSIGTGPDGDALVFAFELQPATSTTPTASAAAVVARAVGLRDIKRINVALQREVAGNRCER